MNLLLEKPMFCGVENAGHEHTKALEAKQPKIFKHKRKRMIIFAILIFDDFWG